MINIEYLTVMSLLFVTDRKFNVYLEVLIGCKNGAYTWDRNLVSFCKVKYKLRFMLRYSAYTILNRHFRMSVF